MLLTAPVSFITPIFLVIRVLFYLNLSKKSPKKLHVYLKKVLIF